MFHVSNSLFSQISRFREPEVKYNSLKYYSEKSYNSECQEIYDQISEMIKNMDRVYNLKELEEFYKERDMWYNHSFLNSDWIKGISWVMPKGVMEANFLVMKTKDGGVYYYPYVPLIKYFKWTKATSPGEFYHENIAEYSLVKYIPDVCR